MVGVGVGEGLLIVMLLEDEEDEELEPPVATTFWLTF